MGITSLTRVDMQMGGAWVNVTPYVRTEAKIMINRGRSGETSGPQPSSAILALLNNDARFTPRNPAGAYYPNFTRTTPLRIGIGVPPQGAGTGNQAASTSISAPAVIAESAGLAIGMWAQESPTAAITVPAGYSAASTVAGTFMTSRSGSLVVAGAGTVAAASASSTVSAVGAGAQVFIPGATFSSVAAAGTAFNASATSEYAPASGGPFTVAVGDALVCCAAWSKDPNNAMVASPTDDSGGMEWQLVADTGPTTGTSPRVAIWVRYANAAATLTVRYPNWLAGAVDVAASIWKVTGATAWNMRYAGRCSDIRTTSDDGIDIVTTVTCGGALRQLGQGDPPEHSALWRQGVQAPAIAYWPLEGGDLATALPSAISGAASATAFGGFAAGADSTTFPFSDPLMTFTAGNVVGQVAHYSSAANVAGGMFGAFKLNVTDPTVMTKAAILMAQTSGATGKIHYLFIQYVDDTHVKLVAFDEALNTIIAGSSLTVPSMLTNALVFMLYWAPNVTNPTTQIDIGMFYLNATTGFSATLFTSTGVATTIGEITAVWLGREPTGTANFTQTFVGGHLGAVLGEANQGGVFMTSDLTPSAVAFQSLGGWIGEDYRDRLLRIGQETSTPIRVPVGYGLTYATAPGAMSVQLPATALDTLGVVQATDLGEMFDARTFAGIGYRSLAEMSAQAAVATLDYSAKVLAAPFSPVDDDSNIRNDVTVAQQRGQQARSVVTAGTLGTTAVGDYDTGTTVAAYDQSRLVQIASWLTHVGTVDEQRFPQVAVPLEASQSLITSVTAVDIGQRVTISNTPAWVQPGPSEELVIGMTEVIGPINEWWITFVTRPYSPFAVFRLDSATFGVLDQNYLGLADQ